MFGQSLNIIWVWDGPTHQFHSFFTMDDRGLRLQPAGVRSGTRAKRARPPDSSKKNASSAFYEKNVIACPKR